MLWNGSEPLDVRILEKFYSKRNKVYKVQIESIQEKEIAIMGDDKTFSNEESNPMIMKLYDNTEALDIEYKNIKRLDELSITVPKILIKAENSLFLDYIKGDLVGDLAEKEDMGNWVDELALWMTGLHNIKNEKGSLLKMDVNLRNFIYADGKVYGLDFEEMSYGDPRTDLANICFFLLTNRPSFTRKKHLIMKRFLKSYEEHSQTCLKDMASYLRWSKEESKRRRNV